MCAPQTMSRADGYPVPMRIHQGHPGMPPAQASGTAGHSTEQDVDEFGVSFDAENPLALDDETFDSDAAGSPYHPQKAAQHATRPPGGRGLGHIGAGRLPPQLASGAEPPQVVGREHVPISACPMTEAEGGK
ncbi:hypothetical protein WJX75_009037 [Coccomyxa subellipsoidea]|uniref:Uncharacterized protein n=1 Tax=Coccomyxa subellipsoidea TaxID=248742 RepID=A0ABR2YU81_9CHLO